MSYCYECGAKIEEDVNFCSNCGSELKSKFKYCPDCGEKVKEWRSFCSRCEHEFGEEKEPNWFKKRSSDKPRYCKNCNQIVKPQNKSTDWSGIVFGIFFLLGLLLFYSTAYAIVGEFYYVLIVLLILAIFLKPFEPMLSEKICPMCDDSNWDWSRTSNKGSKRSSGGL